MTAYKIEGGETLALIPSQNFAGANADIKRAFPGHNLRVLTPYGGGRTPDQQKYLQKIGLTTVSPANSDHVKYIAIDIDNQSTLRSINAAKFEAILKAWGWRETVPFHQERWHRVSDGKRRVSDPNSKYQVYYCIGWINPSTGKLQAKTPEGKTVKGFYYETGNGIWRRTWVKKVARYWSVKFGYGGARDYAYIASQRYAVNPK